jgi:Tol biopolymer transport system component/DNA-binding winged helix-turn-helix (wHTH) protein
MKEHRPSASPIRFGVYEVDLVTEELRKSGLKIRLSGQPFQILAMLLERPGLVVTREELQKKLWPDGTFVDFDHSLNTAINKIREVLGDSAEHPRYVETLARRGYRFIAPVESTGSPSRDFQAAQATEQGVGSRAAGTMYQRVGWRGWLAAASAFAIVMAVLIYPKLKTPPPAPQRALKRLTLDTGLQFGATWGPDGRFVAYSSERGGKFDIWVRPVSGGDAVQVTKGPGHNWQPDWSPDGKLIVFRSERSAGGLYAVPALGGAERKITSFGYRPRWSPDSSQILFETHFAILPWSSRSYVVSLDGTPPREVLAEFLRPHDRYARSTAWHPDGKRISVWVGDLSPSPILWTVPLSGGAAVKTEPVQGVATQLREVALSGTAGNLEDFTFSWAPSGKAIYFGATFGGARNLWRMTIEPETLRATAMERLTTGPGPDTNPRVSPDGGRLAFTAGPPHIRVWLFPFDATRGRVTGKGYPVTPLGMEARTHDLSEDGKKLAFSVNRGREEIWEKSLVEGREGPIASGDDFYSYPQWSPDGTRLAYRRWDPKGRRIFAWSIESRSEEPLTTTPMRGAGASTPTDWSPDGKWLLVTHRNSATDPAVEILPLEAAPQAETKARIVAHDPAYFLFQGHFSPDGRWIVFGAGRSGPTATESTLYVVPESGGPWTRITDGKSWDDKPRWSPDGRTIYFVSPRSGFFNVWGIRFDPAKGCSVGEPFQVTQFEVPGLMIPTEIQGLDLSLTQDRLTLTMTEMSGNIWILDSVDR